MIWIVINAGYYNGSVPMSVKLKHGTNWNQQTETKTLQISVVYNKNHLYTISKY